MREHVLHEILRTIGAAGGGRPRRRGGAFERRGEGGHVGMARCGRDRERSAKRRLQRRP
jgi:hypothetical protein